MTKRIVAVALSIIFACGLLALLVIYFAGGENGPVSLAELGSDATPRESIGSTGDASPILSASENWLTKLSLDTILYGVLGLFVLLVMLRVILSVWNTFSEKKLYGATANWRVKVSPSTASQTPPLRVIRKPRPEESASTVDERRDAPRKSAESEPSFRSIYWSDLRVYWQGLTGKMIGTFAGIVAIFGLVTVGIVYYRLANAIIGQAIQRATLTAVNLGDSVPAYLLAKDTAKLRELLRNHASKPGIAFALLESRAGAIVADSFAVVPDEILKRQPVASETSYGQRTPQIGAANGYEGTVPVLEGQSGAVRVGIWKDDVDAEIDQIVMPIVKLLLMVFAAGIFMAIVIAWNVTRPILRLVRSARRISHGDLDAPSLGVLDRTEFGELSRALERMRSSIKAALVRLS